MKSKSGFTLIELIVVIVIISLLASIAIISYSKIQDAARDNTRSGNATVISDALEKYYNKNGEYPSVRSLANNFVDNTGSAVAARLGISVDNLKMPQMPSSATNAITSTAPPANDYMTYTASSITNNSDCQSLAAGGCGQFTLQYLDQSGNTITLSSRHQG